MRNRFEMKIILCGEALTENDSQRMEFLHQDIIEWKIVSLGSFLQQDDLTKLEMEIQNNTVIICYLQKFSNSQVQNIIQVANKFKFKLDSLPFLIIAVNEQTAIDVKAEYDMKDIFIIKKGINFVNELYHLLFKRCSYYNELGDELTYNAIAKFNDERLQQLMIPTNDVWKYRIVPHCETTLNVLVIGRPGAGKSFLINHLLGDKRCRQGPGRQLTTQITGYTHANYPIQLYDSPSFDQTTYKEFLDQIYERNNDYQSQANYIHVVLLLINIHGRTIYDTDKAIIDQFNKLNIQIYFVFTKIESQTQKISDSKHLLQNELSKMFKGEFPIRNRIYALITIRQNGVIRLEGLSNLLTEICNMLRSNSIQINQISNTEKENPIDVDLIKHSMFFSNYVKADKYYKLVIFYLLLIMFGFSIATFLSNMITDSFWLKFAIQGVMIANFNLLYKKGFHQVNYSSIITLLSIPLLYVIVEQFPFLNDKSAILHFIKTMIFTFGIGGVWSFWLSNKKQYVLTHKIFQDKAITYNNIIQQFELFAKSFV